MPPSRSAGLTALADGRLDEARVELQAVVKATPSDARAWKGLAEVHRRQEAWTAALEALEHVAQSTRGTAEAVTAWVIMAELFDRELDSPNGAQRAWEKVLQLDDSIGLAWLALAELCLRRKKWQSAVAQADHGLQFGRLDAKLRGWLLLCRAIGLRRSSQSVGPTSTFFNQLGQGATGETALQQAFREWPGLRQHVGERPLEDTAATVERVRELRPLSKAPPWWGR